MRGHLPRHSGTLSLQSPCFQWGNRDQRRPEDRESQDTKSHVYTAGDTAIVFPGDTEVLLHVYQGPVVSVYTQLDVTTLRVGRGRGDSEMLIQNDTSRMVEGFRA